MVFDNLFHLSKAAALIAEERKKNTAENMQLVLDGCRIINLKEEKLVLHETVASQAPGAVLRLKPSSVVDIFYK